MGRKRREGGLHVPQYTGAPGCSGQGAKGQSWSFPWSSLTLLGSQLWWWGCPHTADHQALSWAESRLQSLHLRSALFGVVGGGGGVGRLKVLGAGWTLGPFRTSGCWCCPFSALVYPDRFPASRETPSSSASVFGRGFLFIFSAFPYELNPQRSQFLGWIRRIWKWLRGWVGLGSKV